MSECLVFLALQKGPKVRMESHLKNDMELGVIGMDRSLIGIWGCGVLTKHKDDKG